MSDLSSADPELSGGAGGQFDHLITVVSWEERFTLGLKRIFETNGLGNVMLFVYSDLVELKRRSQLKAEELCATYDTEHTITRLSSTSPLDSWRRIETQLRNAVRAGDSVLVDISTMPRDFIWTVFHFLIDVGAKVSYVYNEPDRYPGDWISKNPGRPRLVFQMSGEAGLGKDTVLLIATGFDSNRTAQLMWRFEPRRTILALQVGKQFDNRELNGKMHDDLLATLREYAKSKFETERLEINAYAEDHGRRQIEEHLKPYLDSSNIVMASLGPKLTAVSLFEIHKKYPQTGLVYVPANQYNSDYSKGLGNSHYGSLKL